MARFLAQNFSNLSRRPGQMIGKQRMTIKGFNSLQAREDWCHEHSDNCIGNPIWKPIAGDAKPGTYAMVGGEWRNVKSLDESLLAHV